MLAVGSTLQGRFVIEKVLGHGGMGVVYLARQIALANKPVAIKELIFSFHDPESREHATEQFRIEANLLATLDHPNLVDVTDFFEDGNGKYLVMTYVDGRTLESIVEDGDQFPEVDEVLKWADEICDVLAYLHTRTPPVIYRDLKPSNIMIDPREHVKLLDFGIARAAEDQSQTRTFIKGAGTPGYAPVEQFGQGGTTDTRTDIYSLGATLYTLLTRMVPPSSVDLMLGEQTLVHPRALNPSVPPRLEAVVLKAMALRKEERYPSIQAVRDDLAAVRAGQDYHAPPTRMVLSRPPAAPGPLRLKRVQVQQPVDVDPPRPATSPDPSSAAQLAANRNPMMAPLDEDLPMWSHLLQSREEAVREENQDRLASRRRKWRTYLAVFTVALVAALPALLSPRSPGLLVWLDAIFYNIGHLAYMVTQSLTVAALVSVTLQLAVPIVLYMWCVKQELRFLPWACLYWFGEALVEAGLYMRHSWIKTLPATGGGRYWSAVLNWMGFNESISSIGKWVHDGGLLIMVVSLVCMAWYLVTSRPTGKSSDL